MARVRNPYAASSYMPKAPSGFMKTYPTKGMSGMENMGGFYDKQRQEQSADDAGIDQQLIQKAVFGNVGQEPGESYSSRLNEEMDNPAQPMTEGEANFRADPMALQRLKTMATTKLKAPKAPGADYTDQLIAYANSFKPGTKIQTGVDADKNPIYEPISADAVKRSAMKRSLKFNPNDPRWADIDTRFAAPEAKEPSPEQSGLSKIFSMAKNAASKTLGSMTPDNRPNPPRPGVARIFKSSPGLPSVKGVAEGSVLRANGKKTHILQGGQWQRIP